MAPTARPKQLDCALTLCRCVAAALTALAVEGRLPAYAASLGEVDELRQQKERFFGELLDNAKHQGAERGVEIEVQLVRGHAAQVIWHYAAAHGHDLIVMSHRSHVLGDYVLGSTADRVAHHAQCPVMVVR
jgi:nucleotide-binding universal stress UspA family protein